MFTGLFIYMLFLFSALNFLDFIGFWVAELN